MKLHIVEKVQIINVRCLQTVGLAVSCVGLPVYLISNALFQTAVLRDNHRAVFAKEGVKQLLKKAADWKEQQRWRKQTEQERIQGMRFADFKEEIEQGRVWFWKQDKERITMKSKEGLKLTAYYLPAKEKSDKILILMHGYRNDGLSDFAALVKFYHEMGYHLLVPHQRGHAESEGDYICFGVKERYDLKGWTEYMVKRFNGSCSIFWSGVSMGAATVLMAADADAPQQVKGIIADCGFTSPWEMFACVLKRDIHLPVFPFLYTADFICRRRAGFGFKEYSTTISMKSNRIPVLFIHGGMDDFVPIEMSRRNYDVCTAKKQFLMIDRAGHGTCSLTEPEVYRTTVMEFMEKCENGN